MTDQQGDQRALADALDRFSRKADELLNSGNRNTAHIEINAGGLGLWTAVTASLVMLAVLAVAIPVGVAAYIVTQDQIQALENTDNVIRAYINTGKMPPLPKK
jgi:hypothetical protein